jgi:uncharacterized membrane protein
MPLGYVFEDLGPLEHYSYDPGIQKGVVLGGQDALGGPFATTAAIWVPQQLGATTSGWLMLDPGSPTPSSSWANAASENLDLIAGFTSPSPDGLQQKPCVWIGSIQAGYTVTLLPLPTGATYGICNAVSPNGNAVVGEVLNLGGKPSTACIWMINPISANWEIQIIGGESLNWSNAVGVGNDGTSVYGTISTIEGLQRGVRWSNLAGIWDYQILATAFFESYFATPLTIASEVLSSFADRGVGDVSGTKNGSVEIISVPATWSHGNLYPLFAPAPSNVATAINNNRVSGYLTLDLAADLHQATAGLLLVGEYLIHPTGYESSQAWNIDKFDNICGIARKNGIHHIVKWRFDPSLA